MAKQRLTSLPLGALMKLRNRVSAIISQRATALKKELRSLGEDYKEVGRIAVYGKKKKSKRRKTRGTSAAQSRPRKTAKRRAKARKA